MITVNALRLRRDLAGVMDAVEQGDHVKVTRQAHRNAVLVPEEWHEAADRAMSILRGLTQLGTSATDLETFMDTLQHEVAAHHQANLFGEVDTTKS